MQAVAQMIGVIFVLMHLSPSSKLNFGVRFLLFIKIVVKYEGWCFIPINPALRGETDARDRNLLW